MTDYPRYAAPIMKFVRPGYGPFPVENPRIAYASWLALNFVPLSHHEELSTRLDMMQIQAVHMAAQQLREAGMHEAADLIDPGDGAVSSSPS